MPYASDLRGPPQILQSTCENTNFVRIPRSVVLATVRYPGRMSLQPAGFEDAERCQAAASSLSTRAMLCESALDTSCTTLHHIIFANFGVAHYALVECHRKGVVRPRLHPRYYRHYTGIIPPTRLRTPVTLQGNAV